MSLDREYLDIVDEKDTIVTHHVPYEEVHSLHARHRVVHVLLFNEVGEFLLQLRSEKKKAYPLYWTFSAGGHVQHKESYEEALVREVKEEIGIDVRPDQFVFKGEGVYNDELGHQIYYHTYILLYDGPIEEYKNDEVAAVQFISWETFKNMLTDPQEKIAPEFVEILKRHWSEYL